MNILKRIEAFFKKSWSTIMTVIKIVAIIVTMIFVLPIFTSSKEAKERIKEKKERIDELGKENKETIKKADEVVEEAEKASNQIKSDKEERDKTAKKYFPNLLLVLIPLTFFVSNPIEAQEIITINTSQGKVELSIPSEENLRDGFIEMAILYIEERYDVEELLEKNNNLIESNRELKSQLEETQKELEDTKKLLNAKDPFFQNSISLGLGVQLPDTISPELRYGIIIADTFSINIFARYPIAFGISAGVIW